MCNFQFWQFPRARNLHTVQVPWVRRRHKIGEVGKWNTFSTTYRLANECAKNCCNRTFYFVYATADEADAYMFYRCFFPTAKNETTVLGNGWTDFHETFTKRYRGKWSLQRRAAAWRMANVDDLRNFTLWLWRNHQRAPRTAVAL